MSIEGNGAEAPANVETSAETVETEVQTTEQSTEESSTPDLSKQFAALSRKEKDLRSREQQYEEKLAELEAKFNSTASIEQDNEQPNELPLEHRLKRNPLKTLEEMGFGYEKLTELALNDGKLPPEMQMQLMREELESDYKTKFEELEAKLNEKETAEQEQKYEAVVDNFKTEIKQLVASDTEKYELINASESQELVYDIISEHYNETNRILPIEEAAQAVENHLLEEFQKYSNLKKLSSKGDEASEPSLEELRQSPTLSNDLSAQSINNTDKKLSDDESKAMIAKMIKWAE